MFRATLCQLEHSIRGEFETTYKNIIKNLMTHGIIDQIKKISPGLNKQNNHETLKEYNQ